MTSQNLLESFHRCTRYKEAESWRKPLLDPKRFLANQLRKRGFFRAKTGSFECARTFHLSNFTIVSGENVSEVIVSYGVYEPKLTEAFLNLIKPGQIVVDVGMHLGYYTTLFASLVGAEGQVHAFEPTPSTRELATRNTGLFSNITVHPFAVWSSEEMLQFRDYGTKWMAFNSFSDARAEADMPEPKTFEVRTITLDQFRKNLGKRVSLVKVDAESAEREILQGSRELLAMDRPIVSLEVGDSKNESVSRELVDYMRSLDYMPWEFSSGHFVRHVPREKYSYDNLMFAHQSTKTLGE